MLNQVARSAPGVSYFLAREKMLDANFFLRAETGAEPCAAERRRRRDRGYGRWNSDPNVRSSLSYYDSVQKLKPARSFVGGGWSA